MSQKFVVASCKYRNYCETTFTTTKFYMRYFPAIFRVVTDYQN